jgi:hypothetical protein
MEIGEPKKFSMDSTGLTVQEGITFEEWSEIGRGLFEVHAMSPIWIGDWLNEGEKRWGETYAQAVDITKLSVDTLAHYRSVMGSVPRSVRYPGGTLSHYRVVAGLPTEEQSKILKEAAEQNLSVRALMVRTGAVGSGPKRSCHGCGKSDVQLVLVCQECVNELSENKNQE